MQIMTELNSVLENDMAKDEMVEVKDEMVKVMIKDEMVEVMVQEEMVDVMLKD